MYHRLTLLLFLLSTRSVAQPFEWQWSTSATGSLDSPTVTDIAVDDQGNSYIVGQFYGSCTWGQLPPLSSVGQSDIYVAKYDAFGLPQWVVRGGGSGYESAQGVDVDAAGNVYFTGYFQSPTADLGSTTLSLQGTMNILCAKLNANGQWVWAKRFGSNYTGEQSGEDIVCDANGNLYLTGNFKYYLPVDPLPMVEGCSQLQDAFLLHLNSDGEPVWVRRPECSHDDSYGTSTGQQLALDGLGHLYFGGKFRGDTCFFEVDTLLNEAQLSGQTYDGLIAKYSTNGEPLWVRGIHGYGYDDVMGLDTDAAGNCFVAMHRESEYDFPEFELPVSGTMGIYRGVILKVLANGTIAWGDRIGNSGFDHRISGISVSDQADVYVCGSYQDRCEFDGIVFGGDGPHYGMFLARYDSSNAVQEVWTSRYDVPRNVARIALDGANNLYAAGSFADTLTFPGLPTLTVPDRAAFVARSGDVHTMVAGMSSTSGMEVFPNPSTGQVCLRSEASFHTLRIWNARGSEVVNMKGAPRTLLAVELPRSGLYLYRTQCVDGTEHSGRIVIEH